LLYTAICADGGGKPMTKIRIIAGDEEHEVEVFFNKRFQWIEWHDCGDIKDIRDYSRAFGSAIRITTNKPQYKGRWSVNKSIFYKADEGHCLWAWLVDTTDRLNMEVFCISFSEFKKLFDYPEIDLGEFVVITKEQITGQPKPNPWLAVS
jgi:hypothetical protein